MKLLEVVEAVADKIKSSPHIHAMWIEGSYATEKYNEQSDIDVWLDVDDGKFDECIEIFRVALSEITEIDHETSRGIYSVSPKLIKQTFMLKDFPPGQEIELDLQEHSRGFVFSRSENTLKILFDKDGTIKWDKPSS